MKLVVVDSSIWSLLLRRRPSAVLSNREELLLSELELLGREDRICMLGVIRQELLTGIRSAGHFKRVRRALLSYDDYPLSPRVHELAAENANRCQKRGVTVSTVDILICTVADVEGMAVFSSDPDMERIGRILSLKLHEPRQI